MESTRLLLEDHRHILRALDILEEMASRARHGRKPDERDVEDLLEFLDGYGDRLHQGREEGFLFPALIDHKQKHYTKLSQLSFEHDRQRSLIRGLHESTLSASSKDFVFCATRLVELLRAHMKEEEAALFPLAESTLSQQDDAQTAGEMMEHDKPWRDDNVPELLQLLDRLESIYLGKTHMEARTLRQRSRTEGRTAEGRNSRRR
ncbi:MAG TPA: hemerythrin domain-containing protein [Terriglobia bacterium]|nr:hemerythrin domain-containing protein [Terriglobia bacterium]